MTDEQLRELALAATPGEWHAFYKHKYDEWHVSVPASSGSMRHALFPHGCPTERPRADAEYIASANPAVILALLDEIAALKADAERYRFLRNDVKSAMTAAALVAGCRESMDAAIDRARGAT